MAIKREVEVVVPDDFSETALRVAFIARIPWIKTQQAELRQQERQTTRHWISGETHYLWGRAWRLEVIEHKDTHTVRKGKSWRLQLCVKPGTSMENRGKLLDSYYRNQLQEEIPRLRGHWEQRMGVQLADCRIKKMRTKWGSCNIDAARVWLNLELAKKPYECLEYVFVHELVHLLERNHNARFIAYMDQFMPDWRQRRALLNRLPMAELVEQGKEFNSKDAQ
ncbi:M48 family metallopeptidase [Orrella sp. 11846]|uniref:M48 family metallopeptidase n=1 Tax=Orrella sp. 11846 TaxID=3409913 RepID=UPI003B593131